jgi:hypothetical protein
VVPSVEFNILLEAGSGQMLGDEVVGVRGAQMGRLGVWQAAIAEIAIVEH